MIRLHDVFHILKLGLTPVHIPRGPSSEIRWAHVTELVDPSPWLLGKELLLTTGISLVDKPEEWDAYCRRLRDAGVAAIGFSTGPSLPHRTVPEELVAAARQHEVALVHVPHDTLMQHVVQEVSNALHQAQNQDLMRSLSLQRQLSEAASSPDGAQRIIDVLAQVLRYQVVVLDDRLRTIARSDSGAEARIEPIRDQLKSRLRDGLRWSISEGGVHDTLVVLPLGTAGRLSGILTVVSPGAITMHGRATLGLVASLLGILLERRYASQEHRRMRETQLLERLLDDITTLPETVEYFTKADVNIVHSHVLCASEPQDQTALEGFVVEALGLCEEVVVAGSGSERLFLLLGTEPRVIDALTPLVVAAGLGPAGLSERRALEDVQESVAQARFVRSVAASRDVPVLERIDTGGYRALMMLGTAEVRHQFADTVLSAIDASDASQGTELFTTVRAYVTALGNHAATAEALGVHRHTVRSRLLRITQLTGRDLTLPENFLELWMAIEFRTSNREDVHP
ncbi:PucR family transcriptional regulator [Leucobacter manosquensis]|uniref:PucR family transcriptional regulator n=1 Tax=Leucobacter manosquensis TaxID=2810611 RepID=A0ABS5M605_9MICO|nr:PucR family transcriptional regulator [Leucobacter manosquensis]MBS3182448.1 PucR family transcriptional regulator [Leucobacter manosquensis]